MCECVVMLRAKVGFDTVVEKRPTRKEGRFFFNQVVWVFQPGSEYPVKIVLIIPNEIGENGGYPVGEYVLDLDSSFDQGDFKSADIGFVQKLTLFSVEVYQRKIQLLTYQMNEQLEAYNKFVQKFGSQQSTATEAPAEAPAQAPAQAPAEAPAEVKSTPFSQYGIKSSVKKAA